MSGKGNADPSATALLLLFHTCTAAPVLTRSTGDTGKRVAPGAHGSGMEGWQPMQQMALVPPDGRHMDWKSKERTERDGRRGQFKRWRKEEIQGMAGKE
ncbi:hypothetical protein NQZ68_017212 [Dissostichus eleginoides]|nr:hypothetical protein NQZ68_017212 [Dissostichus eleginoides]